ncbi:hypothetical protein FOZ62_027050 [Perkinsus olseni]|uniref:Uncharacterized protein n=1 Tax=Perkinsus olseni TaxID=32597 RepID=A0A7J6PYQ8_PEROL|nr:hypothetical protein FOZ62_027050 [Perkinsus olseni]
MSAPLDKVYENTGESSGLDVNNGGGAVCEEMERGISLGTFSATCCNALISQALSMPFMFTTAGWFSFIIQALAASLTFVCIQMLRATLRSEKLILLEYFSGLITNLGAIGLCAALIAPAISADVWIIIFSAITLIMILVPWLREISAVMGVLAVVGILGSMAAWVGSAFVILPDSHLIENLTVREPLLINLVTAFSLSMWTSADVPSLPPYLGAIRGSTDRRITLTIIICLTLSVVYVYIIGLAGMQICDGVCNDFYPASLAGFHPAALHPWLVYCIANRHGAADGRLRDRGWTSSGAILVKEKLAYSQAIASVLLTSCALYLCPLWFYAYVMRPVGIKLWAVYVSGVLVAAFVVVGTYTSIMGIISGSPENSTGML